MKTGQEYKNLKAERDALTEALAEWKASAYRSQTDCDVAGATTQLPGATVTQHRMRG